MEYRENTIMVLLRDKENMSDTTAIEILDNLTSKAVTEMYFNTAQLEFDFPKSQAKISYFTEDSKFPDVVLSFAELTGLLKRKYNLIKVSGKYRTN